MGVKWHVTPVDHIGILQTPMSSFKGSSESSSKLCHNVIDGIGNDSQYFLYLINKLSFRASRDKKGPFVYRVDK